MKFASIKSTHCGSYKFNFNITMLTFVGIVETIEDDSVPPVVFIIIVYNS